jgi:hypothetical protein
MKDMLSARMVWQKDNRLDITLAGVAVKESHVERISRRLEIVQMSLRTERTVVRNDCLMKGGRYEENADREDCLLEGNPD